MRSLLLFAFGMAALPAAAIAGDPPPFLAASPTQAVAAAGLEPSLPESGVTPAAAPAAPVIYSEPAAPVPLLPAERKLLRTRRV